MINYNEVNITLSKDKTSIAGFLSIPENAKTIVMFAHGSGSGRFSTRNQLVAKYLVEKNLAILLLDLLSEEEEVIDNETREFRFDIPFLANRLCEVTEWLNQNPKTQSLKIAYFGSSTGAAAALIAAATLGKKIQSLVSRGGRVDLAIPYLEQVLTPTLFIVGGNDYGVLEFNKQAYQLLSAPKKLSIIPEATHLFEEKGALESVIHLAADWFLKHQ